MPKGKVKETIKTVLYNANRPLLFKTILFKVAQHVPEVKPPSVFNALTQLTDTDEIGRMGKSGEYQYYHLSVLIDDKPLDDGSEVAQVKDTQADTAPEAVTPQAAPAPEPPPPPKTAIPVAPFLSTTLKFGPFSANLHIYVDTPDPATRDQALASLAHIADYGARILDLLSTLETNRIQWGQERDTALELAEQATREAQELRLLASQAAPFLARLAELKGNGNGQENGNGHSNGNGNGHVEALGDLVSVSQ